jgi:hypothetical protein
LIEDRAGESFLPPQPTILNLIGGQHVSRVAVHGRMDS